MRTRKLDFQKSRAYRWEDVHVHPRDRKKVPFDQAQALVDYVWQQEGFRHPPRIKLLAPQATSKEATGSRTAIHIRPEGITTTVLLHEIAHSMTSNVDDKSCWHGPRWVGVFMQLLAKYAGFNLPEMMFTAKSAGLQFNFDGPVIERQK